MRIPIAILGGSGYVAGELARLVLAHPRFELAALASTTQDGEPVARTFPHLAGADALSFSSIAAVEELLAPGRPLGIFAATPHGTSAALVDRVLATAERVGAQVRVVDLSADFRFGDPALFAEIYGQPHGAPHRLASFTCAVPEHVRGRPPMHAAQPGCFTTAVVLAAWPFFAEDLVEDELFVTAVTGSSGSGRKLGASTHHPERRSNLFAYGVLAHRHEHEMRALLGRARSGRAPDVELVPCSGPFVRGIHATLRLRLRSEAAAETLVASLDRAYAHTPFVRATLEPPRLADVVGTNRCRIGVAVRGRTLVLSSVVDNLVKGAAGGGVQWMNRLFELADDTGLGLSGLGWY